MKPLRWAICALLVPLFLLAAVPSLSAQTYDASLFAGLRWREIGPYRAGRTRAGSGVPSKPNVFYIGAVNGGVWKTEDAGETWQPIFDGEPTGSIGALAVSPSNPNVIYVGSGEGLARPDLSTGDGMYKSTDGGKTWVHLGLRDGQQIAKIALDPTNPDRLFVAVMGHPYGPNSERGIYRSTDGGESFQKVLYKDENTDGADVEIDPNNPSVVYADLWETRQGPWENGSWSGTNGGLFKSTDGGTTWTQLTGNGLPDGVIQVDLAIAPSDSNRLYASIATARGVAFYRSDDAGASWIKATDDPRPNSRIGGGDLPVVGVDPKNPDVVYVCTPVTWKSTDGGRTWSGFRGSPGGDDYQGIWINPNHPNIILLTSDQGAIVTVDGGATWSRWYNQPTAQVYHVAADASFPYRVCSGQQDAGSACVSSRSDDGEITFHDWHPVGIEEYGYAAPDPLHTNLVYGGKVTRYDRLTGQVANVGPKPLRDYRVLRSQPLMFSPKDPHILYFAANTLWETLNGGDSWRQISPDLTRKSWTVPATVGVFSDQRTAQPSQRGVIYALAPSPLAVDRIWAGTDDGLIWVTNDGGAHWTDVTPPQLQPWWKVSSLDASHFDSDTAYAAINTLRLDDMRPHLFRTHDGGKHWTEIDAGIPDGAATDVVRADPRRQGLLFAGTETQVYVSFDDGDHWQSLRLNMPASSVRDLEIKGDDLIAATHGRGFLILDDITPLRQMSASVASAGAYLFQPQTAIRIRGDMNPPTPWPPEVPAGQNPPDGAIIDYTLGANTSGPVALAIYDRTGSLVRRYSSTDPVPALPRYFNEPLYWVRPPQILSAVPGEHRFLWDMHYPPAPGVTSGLDADEAVVHDTPDTPTSPWVLPGVYTVKLTADGRTYTRHFSVRMDPRVTTPLAGLEAQFRLAKELYDDVTATSAALAQVSTLRAQLDQRAAAGGDTAIAAFEKKLDAVAGTPAHGFGFFRFGGPPTLLRIRAQLNGLEQSIENADLAPTAQDAAACATSHQAAQSLLAQWHALQSQQLAGLPALLRSPAAGEPRSGGKD